MDTMYMTIFLLINAFAIGTLTVLGIQYLRAHRSPSAPTAATNPKAELPEEVRQQLLEAATMNFQTILARTGNELQQDQMQIAEQLTKRLDTLGNTIVEDEMKRYRAKLDELRRKAEDTLARAQTETQTHQDELDAAMEKHRHELEAELRQAADKDRAALQQHLDTKLADAVMAFLLETLGHNIDIGAQREYLLAQLNENKQALIADVTARDTTELQL